MKTRLIILLYLSVSACLPKKKAGNDPEPQLAGTYQISRFVSDGVTLIPRSGVSGQVLVVKDSDTKLSISFTVTNNGKTTSTAAQAVTISKANGTSYTLVDNGASIGSIDGMRLSLDYSDNTSSLSLSAAK
ncbi:hypothetical protein J2I47_07870 [Fibrella sp. HMF5335]|uniref:Lipocalin-like domain-containing protein n=1 Tax=Fibrella rubiginis TaxID=2817060 RepID=A0A939K4R2_9BACT|nr:hypothetical protein [Fibrella rubiginis]MBO0936461.1 hypothetical protein [Fibrella rubiginis]